MTKTPTLPFPLFKDEGLEAEAKTFSNSLVTKYHKQRVSYPHLNTICIDLYEDFPEDKVMERTITLLSNMWTVEPREFTATSGRAGCVWMTPKFPIK